MPVYNFKCPACAAGFEFDLKISEFLIFKKEQNICKSCEQGILIQSITKVRGKVDRDKEYIVEEAKEEARQIVEQINKGNDRDAVDVYGDRPNPLKVK